jgi:hypothetical protein
LHRRRFGKSAFLHRKSNLSLLMFLYETLEPVLRCMTFICDLSSALISQDTDYRCTCAKT